MANTAPKPIEQVEAPVDASTADKKKRVNPQSKPRPAYILLSAPLPEGVEVIGATRKAEEALEAIDRDEAAAYMRIMVK